MTIRLTFGVPAAAVDLARETGSRLLRGDYCALADAGLCNAASIKSNPDIFVMQSAEDWAAKNKPCPLYGAR